MEAHGADVPLPRHCTAVTGCQQSQTAGWGAWQLCQCGSDGCGVCVQLQLTTARGDAGSELEALGGVGFGATVSPSVAEMRSFEPYLALVAP